MPHSYSILLTRPELEALWAIASEGHSARVAFANPEPSQAFVHAADAALEKVRVTLNIAANHQK